MYDDALSPTCLLVLVLIVSLCRLSLGSPLAYTRSPQISLPGPNGHARCSSVLKKTSRQHFAQPPPLRS